MDKFEIRPKLINPYTSIFGFITLLLSVGFGIFLLPKAFNLYLELPNEPDARWPLITVTIVIVVMLTLFLIVIISSLGKKIIVEGKLVYFSKKTLGGFGHWITDRIIDFSKVNIIRDREKAIYVSTGKSIIPIIYYWLVFEMKDGTKQEILLNGWDFGGVKNLFFYIRGKFPEVKLNTKILRDSSEKLSGIDEFLSKQNSP